MLYENEYLRPTMSEYYFYPHSIESPPYYYEMYDNQPIYYYPRYMPPNRSRMNYPPYSYYTENSLDGIQTNRVMQQFLDENGQVDIQKMLKTVGQFADTVQQVSPVIKQLNDLIRSFRS